jgi:hypothetical protein
MNETEIRNTVQIRSASRICRFASSQFESIDNGNTKQQTTRMISNVAYAQSPGSALPFKFIGNLICDNGG